MMKHFHQQGLIRERHRHYRHSTAQKISKNLFQILAERWRISFTTIKFVPKHGEDLILDALILHNILIKTPNSVNVYRPASFADYILEDMEKSEREWRTNVVTFYSIQVPRTGHNVSLYAKSVREKFIDSSLRQKFTDYFLNERAVEWQQKYC